MQWNKKGLIFEADALFEWNKNYASVPTAYKLKNNKIRIYYSSRDSKNRTNISFIETQASDPKNILYIHNKPILESGSEGMFDDSGVMVSHVIDVKDEVWLYYIGWNVRNTIPYHNSIGLAISKDGGVNFRKFSEGPLFDRTYKEPYFSSTPYILVENGIWKMWYLSATKWIKYNNRNEPFYHIKYAESPDGINWIREGKIAINFKDEFECAIARPCVIKESSIYKMWYSYRNIGDYRVDKTKSYRIGYAESYDGITWLRMDKEVAINVSEKGWDSTMIEYPYIYTYQNRKYMLYNGNEFGKTGFGYATLEQT